MKSKLFGKLTALAAIAVMCVAIPQPAPAADATPSAAVDRAAIEPAVAELVKLFGQGRIDQMLDHVGPIPESEREDYERTRERLIAIYGGSGKYSGFDVAGVKSLSQRYQVEYVLVYFEKRPVLFEFGFYQIDGKWRAQNFRLENDFKVLLDTMPLQK